MHFRIPRGELLPPISDQLYDPSDPDLTLADATVRFVQVRPASPSRS